MAEHQKYSNFILLVRQAYPDENKELQFKRGQELWNDCKADPVSLQAQRNTLKDRIAGLQSKSLSNWLKKKGVAADGEQIVVDGEQVAANDDQDATECDQDEPPNKVVVYETPAQDKVAGEINSLQVSINSLHSLRNSGMSSVTLQEIRVKDEMLKAKRQNSIG